MAIHRKTLDKTKSQEPLRKEGERALGRAKASRRKRVRNYLSREKANCLHGSTNSLTATKSVKMGAQIYHSIKFVLGKIFIKRESKHHYYSRNVILEVKTLGKISFWHANILF